MRAWDLSRVRFALPENGWHGIETETVWASPRGGDRFRLENSPFLVDGISFGDEVLALRDPSDRPVFTRLVHKSGHATVRLILPAGAHPATMERHWPVGDPLGCTWERGDFLALPFFALDVPPQADRRAVRARLRAGAADGKWDWEIGDWPARAARAGGGRHM